MAHKLPQSQVRIPRQLHDQIAVMEIVGVKTTTKKIIHLLKKALEAEAVK